jgi:leader peptidase (prepilin peptidase)/N-methyltransferase
MPPLPAGVYPWPACYPLPPWLPPGSWQLGLVTGLAGALAGMLVLRVVRFVFGSGRSVERVGLGDAALMMMAGSFIGWQPVVMALLIGVFPALLLGIYQGLRRRGRTVPFDPPLAVGVLVTLLAWRHIGGPYQLLFFDPLLLALLVALGAVLVLATGFALRRLRGQGSSRAEGAGHGRGVLARQSRGRSD